MESCRNGLLKDVAELVLVFANNPNAPGLAVAEAAGIPIASISSKGKKRLTFDQKVLTLLADYVLDYIVLAGYMRVLTPEFVAAYPRRIINIHPADTTQHQGLHAYEWAWEAGLETTKITVHYVDEGLDTGTIIAQYPVDLRGADSLEEVQRRGLAVEHQYYQRVLAQLFASSTTH